MLCMIWSRMLWFTCNFVGLLAVVLCWYGAIEHTKHVRSTSYFDLRCNKKREKKPLQSFSFLFSSLSPTQKKNYGSLLLNMGNIAWRENSNTQSIQHRHKKRGKKLFCIVISWLGFWLSPNNLFAFWASFCDESVVQSWKYCCSTENWKGKTAKYT